MAPHIVDVDRVLDVADRGAAFAGGAQLRILVDREVGGRFVGRQPPRHRRGGRLLDIEIVQRQRVDRLDQQADDLVGLRGRGRIDHQPVVDGIDPDARVAVDAEGLGQQLVGDALLDFLHLLAARLVALLLFDFLRAGLGDLIDDRGRQQLLLGAQRQQDLAVERMRKQAVLARGYPPQALHFEVIAALVGKAGKAFFQLVAIQGPGRGKPVNLEILEPHGVGQKG